MKIILGSQSSGRKKILTQMGYKFIVMHPNIDEKKIRHQDPKKLVLALAYAKADALLPRIKKPAILITSDQVVYCNNRIIEKPEDKNEAREFLRLYSQHPVKTINATVVTNAANKKQLGAIDTATIWFRPIPEKVIEQLVKKSLILNCAGGFYIDDPVLKKYILKIKGTIESIMGLPKELTEQLITTISN